MPRWLLAAALVWASLLPGTLRAQSRDAHGASSDFELRTAGQLLALCRADVNDAGYIASRAFCYGFVSGGQHYHDEIVSVATLGPIFCPDRQKTRDELVEVFVTYLGANPQHAGDRPVDALFQSFAERWPCPKPKRAGETR